MCQGKFWSLLDALNSLLTDTTSIGLSLPATAPSSSSTSTRSFRGRQTRSTSYVSGVKLAECTLADADPLSRSDPRPRHQLWHRQSTRSIGSSSAETDRAPRQVHYPNLIARLCWHLRSGGIILLAEAELQIFSAAADHVVPEAIQQYWQTLRWALRQRQVDVDVPLHLYPALTSTGVLATVSHDEVGFPLSDYMSSDDVLAHSGAVHASTFDTFLSSTKSLLLGTGLSRQQVALVSRFMMYARHSFAYVLLDSCCTRSGRRSLTPTPATSLGTDLCGDDPLMASMLTLFPLCRYFFAWGRKP